MQHNIMRLNFLEKSHIVIDVGLSYTKAGFVKDSLPMQIFQTPLSMITALHNQHEKWNYTYQVSQHRSKSIRENLSKLNSDSFAAAFRFDEERLRNEVQEFLAFLFYHVLKINPKDKQIILCERLGGQRKLIELLGWVMFKKFQVKSIFSVLSNAMPLYAAGLDTGIVVDCGF